MPNFIWVNGQYLDAQQPVITADDRGFLYGYGLFETLRLYPDYQGFGQPFRLDDHIRRLSVSSRKLKIPLNVSYDSFRHIIERLAKLNNLVKGRVRITLSAGTGGNESLTDGASSTSGRRPPAGRAGTPRGAAKMDNSTCVVMTGSLPDYTGMAEEGVRIEIAPYQRSAESLLYQHKTTNYLENLLFQVEARRNNIFEFLFLNTRNELTEGTKTNIFIVRRGRVLTPALSSNLLPGITRQIVFGLCTGNGIKVREKILKEDDLLSADEVFLTNSLVEILPVVRANDESIGNGKPGETTRRLQKAYQLLVETS